MLEKELEADETSSSSENELDEDGKDDSFGSLFVDKRSRKKATAPPPHCPEEYAKYPVFSTFEADFCTQNKNSPPLEFSMRIGQGPNVI